MDNNENNSASQTRKIIQPLNDMSSYSSTPAVHATPIAASANESTNPPAEATPVSVNSLTQIAPSLPQAPQSTSSIYPDPDAIKSEITQTDVSQVSERKVSDRVPSLKTFSIIMLSLSLLSVGYLVIIGGLFLRSNSLFFGVFFVQALIQIAIYMALLLTKSLVFAKVLMLILVVLGGLSLLGNLPQLLRLRASSIGYIFISFMIWLYMLSVLRDVNNAS